MRLVDEAAVEIAPALGQGGERRLELVVGPLVQPVPGDQILG